MLYKKLLGANCPAPEQESKCLGIGPPNCYPEAEAAPRYTHRNDALQKWRAQMRDHPHACQWLRKEEAAPLAFKDADLSIFDFTPKL